MKIGKTIVELAQEIERQGNAKRDYVVSSEHLAMVQTTDGHELALAD